MCERERGESVCVRERVRERERGGRWGGGGGGKEREVRWEEGRGGRTHTDIECQIVPTLKQAIEPHMPDVMCYKNNTLYHYTKPASKKKAASEQLGIK